MDLPAPSAGPLFRSHQRPSGYERWRRLRVAAIAAVSACRVGTCSALFFSASFNVKTQLGALLARKLQCEDAAWDRVLRGDATRYSTNGGDSLPVGHHEHCWWVLPRYNGKVRENHSLTRTAKSRRRRLCHRGRGPMRPALSHSRSGRGTCGCASVSCA